MMFQLVVCVYVSSIQVPYFQIFVKGEGGKNTALWVKGSDLVDDIKCKIAFK